MFKLLRLWKPGSNRVPAPLISHKKFTMQPLEWAKALQDNLFALHESSKDLTAK